MRRLLALLGVCFLIGCGGGGGSTSAPPSSEPTTSSATMAAGQWEFVATPTSGAKPVYFEVNLALSPDQVTSTVFNTSLFQFGGSVGGVFSDCGNFDTSASVANGTMGGLSAPNLGVLESPGSSGPEANFVATIAPNGQAVTGGSYKDYATMCDLAPTDSTGTFSGYIVSPLNGTFTGTLTGTSAGPDQITIRVTQDSNFGITATGTSVQNLVTTSLSIVPQGASSDNTGGYSNVIGATVQGSGTSSNINGDSTFQVFGHFNATGTQIQIISWGQLGMETGILTKQ
jgi:hypothetical protein